MVGNGREGHASWASSGARECNGRPAVKVAEPPLAGLLEDQKARPRAKAALCGHQAGLQAARPAEGGLGGARLPGPGSRGTSALTR